MKKFYLTILTLLILATQPIYAVSGIGLKFNRTGTDASSVTVTVVDENGTAINGATATVTTSHSFKGTSNAVTGAILCPNANANTNPTIELTFAINGIPANFAFNKVGLDIHALNGGSNYQEPGDGVTRQWNVTTTVNNTTFGTLDNIDIAAGVGSSGNVHKVWDIAGTTVNTNGSATVKLTITKGTTNGGCFFGLSEVQFTFDGETPTPEPEPEPDTDGAKVYYIQWKNTGTNYITEESDHRMTVQSNDVTKPQFWQFIPTENQDCYYIKNTATGRYIGSCNLTPSSASKIYTSTTPVEYYVKQTTATSGDNANCWYFSSTDCDNYNSESAGPRALNKDGASNYVITWTAGTSNVGSYWKLVETEDLYEVRPFDGSSAIGSIGTSYNMECINGKNLTIADGTPALATPDAYDDNQEWYFVGTGNAAGWQIASAAEPAVVVGISQGNITAGEGLTTKWKIYGSQKVNGYYYFASEGQSLKIDGDSLFRFTRLRSAYARKLQIYNNPCGTVGNNYVTSAKLSGKAAIDNITYSAQSKPSTWHIVYAHDKGEVAKGNTFNFDVTLSASAASDLVVAAHFDWNGDGIFETEAPLTVNGTTATAEITVPEWATMEQTRMRLRVNSNGLDLAEDEVNGFIYDFHIKVVEPQETRTVTVSVNAEERGKAELSEVADNYTYGTTLTATATAYGSGTFVCWKEEGVVVSTEASYTFTVDHNVKLVAIFNPNLEAESLTSSFEQAVTNLDAAITSARAQAAYIGTGIGLYSYTGEGDYNKKLAAYIAFRESITDDNQPTTESVKAQTAELLAMIASITLNTPATSKYYRLKNAVSNRYMSGNASNVTVIDDGATAASTIFYLTENNELLSYTQGRYLNCAGKILAGVGTSYAGEFDAAYGTPTLNVITYKNNGYWTFGNRNNGVSIDRGSNAPNQAGYNWYIEEVTTLPVTIGTTNYVTLFAPVALTVPAGATAYTVTIDGEWAVLSDVGTTIPANTGVVISANEGTHHFAITSTDNNTTSELAGTIASAYITADAYILSQPEGEPIGFYVATSNGQNAGTFLNNSHKAYLPKPTNSEGIAFYSFRFGEGTSNIESVVENEAKAIFDITGRRISTISAPGIYIINGKKVLVK